MPREKIMPSSVTQGSKHYLIIYYLYYKEESHTNIKDLPKQLAKLNVCILYVIMSITLIPSISHRKIQ